MHRSNESSAGRVALGAKTQSWIEPAVAVVLGACAAALGRAQLEATPAQSVFFGALFGVFFWWGFSKRADSPGAGLIWGLGFAALVWLLIPQVLRHS